MCRHSVVITVSVENKTCIDVLIFVVGLCFTNMLLDLLGLIGNRTLYSLIDYCIWLHTI